MFEPTSKVLLVTCPRYVKIQTLRVESEPDRFPQRFPQARKTLLVGGFSGQILFTKKSSDSLTKVIPSLHVILLAVRDRQ